MAQDCNIAFRRKVSTFYPLFDRTHSSSGTPDTMSVLASTDRNVSREETASVALYGTPFIRSIWIWVIKFRGALMYDLTTWDQTVETS